MSSKVSDATNHAAHLELHSAADTIDAVQGHHLLGMRLDHGYTIAMALRAELNKRLANLLPRKGAVCTLDNPRRYPV